MNNLTSRIVLAIFINLLNGCSSKNVVSTEALIPFEEQYVKGDITKLQDSLSGVTLKDSVLIVPSSSSPFSPTTDISFHVFRENTVTISFLELNHKFICEAFSGYLLSGNYKFKATDFHINTGVYLLKCQVGNRSALSKMMIMR
ncbi:MAG: hypothetical protein HZB59_08995 [Ignavibacteriales bacterium]|nr:hypothetical protein [Ignavibacteriales bacterium]